MWKGLFIFAIEGKNRKSKILLRHNVILFHLTIYHAYFFLSGAKLAVFRQIKKLC